MKAEARNKFLIVLFLSSSEFLFSLLNYWLPSSIYRGSGPASKPKPLLFVLCCSLPLLSQSTLTSLYLSKTRVAEGKTHRTVSSNLSENVPPWLTDISLVQRSIGAHVKLKKMLVHRSLIRFCRFSSSFRGLPSDASTSQVLASDAKHL